MCEGFIIWFYSEDEKICWNTCTKIQLTLLHVKFILQQCENSLSVNYGTLSVTIIILWFLT